MLEVIEMLGPGEYVADKTQGITRFEDLPRPKRVRRNRNYKRRPWTIWQHPKAIIRTGWSQWRCGLLLEMVFVSDAENRLG